jgi:hypothetical protein
MNQISEEAARDRDQDYDDQANLAFIEAEARRVDGLVETQIREAEEHES